MSVLRRFYACFLLLCFLRMLLPEAWILVMHQHEHTWEEPAHKRVPRHRPIKAVLTAKHQHCQVDHVCNIPFQPATPLELAAILLPYQRTTTVALLCTGNEAEPIHDYLRGPPVT